MFIPNFTDLIILFCSINYYHKAISNLKTIKYEESNDIKYKMLFHLFCCDAVFMGHLYVLAFTVQTENS